MLLSSFLTIASALTAVNALAPTRLIYQYPVGSWLENLAARYDGSLLLTSLGFPGGLSLLVPKSGATPVQLLSNFPNNATLGIVETTPDVFYFIGANFTFVPPSTVPGTNNIWKYDFSTGAGLSLALNIPNAQFLNGLTKFNNNLLFAADSKLGAVWAIDLKTPRAYILAQDPLMAPPPNQIFSEGINGLHLYKGNLYFTNSQKSIYAVLKLDANGNPLGPAKLVANALVEKNVTVDWDDFSFDAFGTAYIATEIGNTIQSVTCNGKVQIVAGDLNSTAIAQPSSTVFGRGLTDRNTLYVTTAGGIGFPVYVNGQPQVQGAQVVAVDL